MNKKTRGFLCGIIGAVCWGFSGCCGQYLFTEKAMDPNWLTTVRLLTSGTLLIILALFTQKDNLKKMLTDKKDVVRLVCYGIFGLMLCQLSYLTAIRYTNAATATVIQYAGPVLVMLAVCLMQKKLPQWFEFAALVLAVSGTFLIVTHGDPHTLVISPQGLWWSVLGAFTIVTYTLIPGPLIAKRSSIVVNGWGMLVGGIVLLFITRPWHIAVNLDAQTLLALAGIIIVGTVAAFSLYMQAVSDIGPVRASIIASIEPVASAVISWLWLGSRFAAIDLIGFALIISTVFLLSGKHRKHTAHHRAQG